MNVRVRIFILLGSIPWLADSLLFSAARVAPVALKGVRQSFSSLKIDSKKANRFISPLPPLSLAPFSGFQSAKAAVFPPSLRTQLKRAGIADLARFSLLQKHCWAVEENYERRHLQDLLKPLEHVRCVADLLQEALVFIELCECALGKAHWKCFTEYVPQINLIKKQLDRLIGEIHEQLVLKKIDLHDELTVIEQRLFIALPVPAAEDSTSTELVPPLLLEEECEEEPASCGNFIREHKATTLMLGTAALSFVMAGKTFPLLIPLMVANACTSAALSWGISKFLKKEQDLEVIMEEALRSGAWSIFCQTIHFGFVLPTGQEMIGVLAARVVSGATLSATAELVRSTDHGVIKRANLALCSLYGALGALGGLFTSQLVDYYGLKEALGLVKKG